MHTVKRVGRFRRSSSVFDHGSITGILVSSRISLTHTHSHTHWASRTPWGCGSPLGQSPAVIPLAQVRVPRPDLTRPATLGSAARPSPATRRPCFDTIPGTGKRFSDSFIDKHSVRTFTHLEEHSHCLMLFWRRNTVCAPLQVNWVTLLRLKSENRK